MNEEFAVVEDDKTTAEIEEFMEDLTIPHKNELVKMARSQFTQYTTVCKKIASFFYEHQQLGDEEVFRLTRNSGLVFQQAIACGEKMLAKLNLAFMGSGNCALPTQAPLQRLRNKRRIVNIEAFLNSPDHLPQPDWRPGHGCVSGAPSNAKKRKVATNAANYIKRKQKYTPVVHG